MALRIPRPARTLAALARLSCVSLALAAGAGALAAAPAGADYVGSGSHPIAVVLCNFTNAKVDAGTAAYYRQMYTSAGANSGQYNFVDFWHDVSFGQLDVSGTQVITGPHADANGWYTIPEARETWETESRGQKVIDCANAASADVDFSKYYGVVALYPDGAAALTAPISSTATTMTLNESATSPTPTPTTANYFPAPPFLMSVGSEKVLVTATSGNVFTIVRAQSGTTAAAHATGTGANVPGDFGEYNQSPVGTPPGQSNVTLNSGSFHLSLVVLPNEANLTGAGHETGHGYGYNHSRALSNSTNDYNDSTDIMSAFSGTYEDTTLGTPFGGSVLGSQPGDKGPGLTSIQLDYEGWIPAAKHYTFNNSVPGQATINIHALSDPAALSSPDDLEARIPDTATVIQNSAPTPAGGSTPPPTNPPTCSGTGFSCTNSVYYTVEYRQKTGWDSGFPVNAVVLHLLGRDGRAYWVDKTPLAARNGLLQPGDEYVDAPNKAYVAVNAINPATDTATVTLGASKIVPTLKLATPPSSGDYDDATTIAADLTVSGKPVPNQLVTLAIGTQQCTQSTDATGHVSCPITPTDVPGATTVTASFAGDAAYTSASDSDPFTINREETKVNFLGPASISNGTPATLRGSLYEDGITAPTPSGQTVTLSIGSGATAQSCTGTVDSTGQVSCTIPNVNQPDTSTFALAAEASFAGDSYYLPSTDTSQTVSVLYYTGRAYASSLGLFGLAPGVFGDTGEVKTAQASTVTQTPISVLFAFGSVGVPTASVVTGHGTSTAKASAASVGIAGLLLPTISVSSMSATSTSTCTGATGSSSFASVSINGLPINVSNLPPNTVIPVVLGTVTLNEQIPVTGADHGLTVNAIHVNVPGIADYVLASATSDIHNC